MSEVVCIKPQEEYQDDFEKDLDWLINEESRSEGQVRPEFVFSFSCFTTLLCFIKGALEAPELK